METEKTGKRGRPPYKPSAADRKRVSIAAGGGMTREEIATALEIDVGTLGKYFEHELSVGAYQRRMEIVDAMFHAAKRGSVAAAKLYAQIAPASAPIPPASPDRPPKPAALGKKEQAQIDARTAQDGTDWESLLPTSSTTQ